jgi:hypothetical protein
LETGAAAVTEPIGIGRVMVTVRPGIGRRRAGGRMGIGRVMVMVRPVIGRRRVGGRMGIGRVTVTGRPVIGRRRVGGPTEVGRAMVTVLTVIVRAIMSVPTATGRSAIALVMTAGERRALTPHGGRNIRRRTVPGSGRPVTTATLGANLAAKTGILRTVGSFDGTTNGRRVGDPTGPLAIDHRPGQGGRIGSGTDLPASVRTVSAAGASEMSPTAPSLRRSVNVQPVTRRAATATANGPARTGRTVIAVVRTPTAAAAQLPAVTMPAMNPQIVMTEAAMTEAAAEAVMTGAVATGAVMIESVTTEALTTIGAAMIGVTHATSGRAAMTDVGRIPVIGAKRRLVSVQT